MGDKIRRAAEEGIATILSAGNDVICIRPTRTIHGFAWVEAKPIYRQRPAIMPIDGAKSHGVLRGGEKRNDAMIAMAGTCG